jgi:hypothetical protein
MMTLSSPNSLENPSSKAIVLGTLNADIEAKKNVMATNTLSKNMEVPITMSVFYLSSLTLF